MQGFRYLSAEALKSGFEVEVVCVDDPLSEWLTDTVIPVHPVGRGTLATFGYCPRLDKWLAQNIARFDIVVLHGLWMYLSSATRNAATRRKIPYVLFTHGFLDPWFRKRYPIKHLKKVAYWRLFEHKVLRDASAVLFTTEEEKVLAESAFRPYVCRPSVVGYGITKPADIEGSTDTDQRQARLSRYYPQLQDRRFILYLGRVHEKKGIDLLLRGFAVLARNSPGMTLVIAGPCENGYSERLRGLAKKLAIGDRVLWPGPVYDSAKWALLTGADAYAMPSHQENFGISVVEALASGTPVLISNRVNIWREVAADSAGLIDSDDVEGATRLLTTWLAMSDGEKAKMRTNARSCFAQHFDISVSSGRYLNLLVSAARARLGHQG
jgi:glycosyltransferase involved in cell wall biosynthesis